MFLSLSLALGISSVASLHMPFKRQAPHSTNMQFNSKLSTSNDTFGFGNVNDGGNKQIYVVELQVGGKPFEVQLDTGSADLWLDTKGLDTKGFTDTGEIGHIGYGDGTSATGPILLGDVTLGAFTVKNQAFISAPGTNATSNGDKGLLGIGPPGESNVARQLKNSTKYDGSNLIDNIFAIYPNEPNFMTFMLSRSTIGTTDGGIFTIGEVDMQHTAIQARPKNKVLNGTSEWLILADSVIVNGKEYKAGSRIPEAGTQTVTLIDTGNPQDLAPKIYVDAMYAQLKGAKVEDGTYTVPCDSKVEITFVVNGEKFPIDPIDAVFAALDSSSNKIVCTGAWSYTPDDFTADMVFGDPFLRNAYSLFDFGTYTTVGDTPPFVQLLSTTDANKSSSNFANANNARLAELKKGGKKSSTTSDKTASDLADTNTTNTTSSSSPQDAITSDQASTLIRNSYIVMGFLVAIIVSLFGLAAATLLKGRRKSGGGVATRSAPGQFEVPFLRDQKYSTVYDHDRD